MLAAFPDHVAKLDREHLQPDEKLVPYLCTAVPEAVYLHPSSGERGPDGVGTR